MAFFAGRVIRQVTGACLPLTASTACRQTGTGRAVPEGDLNAPLHRPSRIAHDAPAWVHLFDGPARDSVQDRGVGIGPADRLRISGDQVAIRPIRFSKAGRGGE